MSTQARHANGGVHKGARTRIDSNAEFCYETFVADHTAFEDPKAEQEWLDQFGAQGYKLVSVGVCPVDATQDRFRFVRRGDGTHGG